MAHTIKMIVCVSGHGTVATADQVQSFLVEQGYNDPHRLAVDEGNGIFSAGVAIEGSERRILSECGRWEPESGDLVKAVTEIVGHDDWQAIVALGVTADTAGEGGSPSGSTPDVPPHTGQYL